jgi:hypothetical protein
VEARQLGGRDGVDVERGILERDGSLDSLRSGQLEQHGDGGVGQRLVFLDMSHYTFVKSSTFNGTPLPSIVTYDSASKAFQVIKKFGYGDYKNRLS